MSAELRKGPFHPSEEELQRARCVWERARKAINELHLGFRPCVLDALSKEVDEMPMLFSSNDARNRRMLKDVESLPLGTGMVFNISGKRKVTGLNYLIMELCYPNIKDSLNPPTSEEQSRREWAEACTSYVAEHHRDWIFLKSSMIRKRLEKRAKSASGSKDFKPEKADDVEFVRALKYEIMDALKKILRD